MNARRSLYGPVHVELLLLIKRFQAENLSLDAIRRVFEEEEFDPGAIELRLASGTFGEELPEAEEDPGEPLPEELVARLEETGILSGERTEEGELFETDAAVARIALRADQAGLDTEVLVRLRDAIRDLVRVERDHLWGRLAERDDSAGILREVEVVDGIVNAFVAAAKRQMLHREVERTFEEGTLAVRKLLDRQYLPSEGFQGKHGLDTAWNELREQVRETGDVDAARRLARFSVALGHHGEARRAAQIVLDARPDDPGALLSLAGGHVFCGRPDEARKLCDRVIVARSRNPAIRSLAGTACILEAAALRGVLNPGRLLERALAYFDEAHRLEGLRIPGSTESLLLRGRLLALLPETFGRREEGIAALGEVLRRLAARPERDLLGVGGPGAAAIVALNAHYFLGEALAARGDLDSAQQHWKDVIVADPRSNFAELVYRKLEPGASVPSSSDPTRATS